MCEAASFIVTRHKVWWSKTSDSHQRIAEEHGLVVASAEAVAARRLQAVPVEVVPPNADYSRPIDEWAMQLDSIVQHDILPDWWDSEDARRRCKTALVEWAKIHILTEGEHHASGDVSFIVRGSAVLWLDAQSGGRCWAHSGGTVNSSNQSGGDCVALSGGTVNSTNQSGGGCWADSGGTVNSTNQSGGDCWADSGGTVNVIVPSVT